MDVKTGSFEPDDFGWRGITMTSAAAAHMRELAEQKGVQGIRLAVKTSGCAGFTYVLDTVTLPGPDDLLFECDGARLWVSSKAMPFIDGTEVDYVREGVNQLFRFHNPKAQNECGCGESFGVQVE